MEISTIFKSFKILQFYNIAARFQISFFYKFLLQFYLLAFLFQVSVTNLVACFWSYNLVTIRLLPDKHLLHSLLIKPALDRKQKVACDNSGTRVSKQNLSKRNNLLGDYFALNVPSRLNPSLLNGNYKLFLTVESHT